MFELLYRIFIGHTHVYETFDQHIVNNEKGKPQKMLYVQKCSVCGKIKQTLVCDK